MSTSFLQSVTSDLLKHEEVDWFEEKVTLRIRSEGKHDPVEEIEAWADVFAETALKVINRVSYAYRSTDENDLAKHLRARFLKEFDLGISEQFG